VKEDFEGMGFSSMALHVLSMHNNINSILSPTHAPKNFKPLHLEFVE
jgi:hypothetical protein